ncbi:MAG: biotin--[acetyl-CoA-carboxylase] ligase [Firmicutes bacterium]|nr:biotin--[acetyl-CoA-carboxylase] ligase [Bacillota bacterium]MCM1401052.1 biotin--[acetyl-CoA-carboxylase] ligase [Bacteroides sp.]MCM1476971.1 biotin--[acetyl-CoA-carboxylase] ligase [Bacteroides sp.]
MDIIRVDSTESTNALAWELLKERNAPFAVMAHTQTAGRGQRGNHWESEPGRNVTLSIAWCPGQVAASEQFVISQAVAVAIVETLRHFMPELTPEIAIKWPNDIYVGQRKICGVLIENSLSGCRISRTVIGIGLNVNQRTFLSDAPNPVSMFQLTRKTFDVNEVALQLCNTVEHFFNALLLPHRHSRLRGRYFSMLWRSVGYWPYLDVEADELFEARVSNIAPSGHITLTERSGHQRTFAFKEVQSVFNSILQ